MGIVKVALIIGGLFCAPVRNMKTELTYVAYRTMIPIVDVLQSIKRTMLFFILVPLKKTTRASFIQQRLAAIEYKIRAEEHSVIQAVAHHYDISDDELQNIMSLANQHKRYQQEYLLSAHEEVTHDATFPQEIIPLLIQNNMHPKSIILRDSKEPHHKFDATAHDLHFNYKVIQGTLHMYRITSVPKIVIYPRFYRHPNEIKLAVFLHEIRHIKEGHGITRSWLERGISRITNTDGKIISTSDFFEQLKTVHESQAEILPSLQDSRTAGLFRQERSIYYYSGRLFIRHYAQLAEIDELYKLNNALAHYKPMRVQNSDISFFTDKSYLTYQ